MEEKWYKVINKDQRNALIGGMGGWTLDAMDMLLYIMSLTAIMKDFRIDTAVAGLLASVTLLSSAVGGTAFGDRDLCLVYRFERHCHNSN